MADNKKRRGRPPKAASSDPALPTVWELSRLLDDLRVIADEHPDLYFRIYELIGWMLLPRGPIWRETHNKKWARYVARRHRLDDPERTGTAEEALEEASADLRRTNHPAAGSPRTVRAGFESINSKLPDAMQRPRTYRRRSK